MSGGKGKDSGSVGSGSVVSGEWLLEKKITNYKLQITNKAVPYGHIGMPLRREAHRVHEEEKLKR